MSATDNVPSGNRLLVMDDEPAVGTLIGRVARRAGFDVIVTNDPKDFKQRVRSWRPALISLDLAMPETDGVELLRYLADERVTSRILIVSGFDERVLNAANHLGAARGLNMAGVLRKPVEIDQLRELLRKVDHDVSAITAQRLAEALDAGELYLEYQPKIDLHTGQTVGVEALARWQHPVLGNVPPMKFIPVAEDTELIHRFTQWVLGEAIRQHHLWAREHVTLSVAVNLSAKNVEDHDLTDLLVLAQQPPEFAPRHLVLELTESSAMRDVEHASDLLTRLRIRGMGLSIDDFGTGYSSLAQLRRLPFSEVKIDKSFVFDCAASKDNAAIVRAIIDLTHHLGLKVVAEGVETQEALDLLTEAGCDAAQGYFFSNPIRAEKIPSWVAANQNKAA